MFLGSFHHKRSQFSRRWFSWQNILFTSFQFYRRWVECPGKIWPKLKCSYNSDSRTLPLIAECMGRGTAVQHKYFLISSDVNIHSNHSVTSCEIQQIFHRWLCCGSRLEVLECLHWRKEESKIWWTHLSYKHSKAHIIFLRFCMIQQIYHIW